ncbi:MAG TPA: T9SS type A sorting domain-containing protein, partial [Bacteroidota bacterium]|nr:T9SS type A sorting domain-containing protein [Bacteroidota bacterium]
AIVNTARNLGLGANLQGGGRVRALQAVAAKTLVVPATLSFGMDDPSSSTWMKPETLFVSNTRSSTQSYAVAAGGLVPGISLDVSPDVFSIPANDSARVIVTLAVNNALILNEDHNVLRYSGAVAFNGTIDTANVPWAFARTNRLVITTSEPNAFFFGFTNATSLISTERRVIWTSPTRAEVFAFDKGVYEFFTLFRNPVGKSKIVINEGVNIGTDVAALTLDGAMAVYPLVYHGVDHLGVGLNTYSNPQRTLISTLPNFGDWITTLTGGSDTLLLSPVSTAHSFKPVEFQIDAKNTGTFHSVQYDRFSGMSGAKTLTNSPAGYIQEHFRVNVPPGTSRAANILVLYAYTYAGGIGTFGGLGFGLDTIAVGHDKYAFTGYFGRSPSPTEDVAALFYTSYSDVQRLSLDYQSPFIMPYGDSVVATPREFVTPAVPRFESGSTMTFGGAPIHLLMLWYPNIIGTNTLQFRTLFRGMLNEDRNLDVSGGTYSLFDRNGVRLFTKPLDESRPPLQLTSDRYRMVVASGNSWLRNARASVTMTSEFTLANGFNANPPSVTSLTILDAKGHTTDSLAKGGQAMLRFSFNDIYGSNNALPLFDSTKAWCRKHGTTEWKPLAVTKVMDVVANEGTIVSADLGPATQEDSVAVDLRIASADADGFTTDYVVSPAFVVGNWDTAVATGVRPPDRQSLPGSVVLEQNFPNPFNPSTTIGYALPRGVHVTLTVFNILGQQVATLVNEYQQAGFHQSRFDGAGLSSGVYFYRLSAGEYSSTRRLLLLR